jgi:hypothetical protein
MAIGIINVTTYAIYSRQKCVNRVASSSHNFGNNPSGQLDTVVIMNERRTDICRRTAETLIDIADRPARVTTWFE